MQDILFSILLLRTPKRSPPKRETFPEKRRCLFFCVDSEENTVLTQVFEEHYDNKKIIENAQIQKKNVIKIYKMHKNTMQNHRKMIG